MAEFVNASGILGDYTGVACRGRAGENNTSCFSKVVVLSVIFGVKIA